MKSALFNHRDTIHPVNLYPVYLTKRIGKTKFAKKVLYCPGTYALKVHPMHPKDFGLIRANARMHRRTNHR